MKENKNRKEMIKMGDKIAMKILAISIALVLVGSTIAIGANPKESNSNVLKTTQSIPPESIQSIPESSSGLTELYYDDGEVDFGWSSTHPGGAAVLFTPPATPWILSKIKVSAGIPYQRALFMSKFGITIEMTFFLNPTSIAIISS